MALGQTTDKRHQWQSLKRVVFSTLKGTIIISLYLLTNWIHQLETLCDLEALAHIKPRLHILLYSSLKFQVYHISSWNRECAQMPMEIYLLDILMVIISSQCNPIIHVTYGALSLFCACAHKWERDVYYGMVKGILYLPIWTNTWATQWAKDGLHVPLINCQLSVPN